MTDLTKAIAAAREALADTYPEFDSTHRYRKELRDILAALDAARGRAVAWVEAGDLEEVAENGYANAEMLDEDVRGRPVGLVPLYAGLPAAAVPAGFADWLAREMPAGTVIGDPQWWAKLIARRFAQFAAAVPWPKADDSARALGWTWDYRWIESLADATRAAGWDASMEAIDFLLSRLAAQQPAAAVPAANVRPMRQPRADLARLVESINAAVYANGNGLSVTEAIGALELAKLELLKEQEQ